MARFFITGIAGFIGSSLAHELLTRGHEVSGLDNLSTGRLDNLADITDHIRFTEGDIRNLDAVQQAMTGADFVLHQAALASVPRSVDNPLASHDSNINGTLNVLIAARDAKVKRIVYAASSSAYGNQLTQPKHETMMPQPLSPYAAQKLAGEHYLQSFCKVYGMEGVCLRYFNIYGPRQAADSPYSGVIAQFIRKMISGVAPTIHGDGSTSRDFTFVQNAVQANLLACETSSQFATGRVYNVGTGHSHTLNGLYGTLAKILKFKDQAHYTDVRTGDVKHSLASIERAEKELGYVPQADFSEGLAKTVDWYLTQEQNEPVQAYA